MLDDTVIRFDLEDNNKSKLNGTSSQSLLHPTQKFEYHPRRNNQNQKKQELIKTKRAFIIYCQMGLIYAIKPTIIL